MKLVHWDELNCYGGNSHCTCTPEQAIQAMHSYADRTGKHRLSDEHALEDFLTTHWAWIEED